MEWNEIKMRLRDGASVQILADLEGVPYKTMYNRIKQHELKDGKTYMNASALKARGGRRTTKKPDEKKVTYKKPEVIEAPKQKIECREVNPVAVIHPSPEQIDALRKLEESRDKLVSAYGEMMKKVGEKLREAIPTPDVKIQVVEDAEKGPEEEGESPELTVTKCNICDTCIHNLDTSCEFVSRRADFRRSGCNQYKNKDEYINELRAEEAGTPSECPEEEGGSPEEKWQKQQLSRVADKIIDELDQRIDLLNDELQRIEDKKIELLYEVGIWKNIMNALQRERGIK